jgi:antitoxin CptB
MIHNYIQDSEVEQRVYWRCRRGMLELDIMLQGFLERDFKSLDDPKRKAFLRLLDYPDSILLELLLGQTISSDEDVNRVVKQIRAVTTH